ncbi:MAG: ELWxxDGT repeat protein, partial [Thermomicrobiales bacterium]
MMRHRIFTVLFITLFVVGAIHFTTGRVAAADQQCFPQTGKCLQGRFLDYWLAHGGLAINGYPITNEQTEKLEDGKDYLVQCFERVRMEYHPESANPQYQVLLGQFGRILHPADPPVAAQPGQRFFMETGHNV